MNNAIIQTLKSKLDQYCAANANTPEKKKSTVNSLVSDQPWFTRKWSLTRGGRLREQNEGTQGISTVSIVSCRDFILWLC